MRRRKLSVWVILTLLAVLVTAPGSAVAKGTRIDCTGTESALGMLDPGTWIVTPSGNIHVRDMVSQYQETSSSCPQNSGITTVTMNANWDANYAGPIWGTARLETDFGGGGIWETSWSGMVFADGSAAYHAVGHGVSGSVEGYILRLSAANSEWTATILLPHGG